MVTLLSPQLPVTGLLRVERATGQGKPCLMRTGGWALFEEPRLLTINRHGTFSSPYVRFEYI
jgi:hypothetical protein